MSNTQTTKAVGEMLSLSKRQVFRLKSSGEVRDSQGCSVACGMSTYLLQLYRFAVTKG